MNIFWNWYTLFTNKPGIYRNHLPSFHTKKEKSRFAFCYVYQIVGIQGFIFLYVWRKWNRHRNYFDIFCFSKIVYSKEYQFECFSLHFVWRLMTVIILNNIYWRDYNFYIDSYFFLVRRYQQVWFLGISFFHVGIFENCWAKERKRTLRIYENSF